jgi:hypothetical protein
VRAHVFGEVAALVESFPTQLALEWLVAGVQAGVCVEAGALAERLGALRARVWLLTSVNANVLSKICRRTKMALAEFTQMFELIEGLFV